MNCFVAKAAFPPTRVQRRVARPVPRERSGGFSRGNRRDQAGFVVNGAAQASNSALTSASAEMKWLNGWSAAATFEGEFSDVTRSYAGKGLVRYAW